MRAGEDAARSWRPVSTPATSEAPDLQPATSSVAVSPTTAISRTSATPSRRAAVSTTSGCGGPRRPTASSGVSVRSATSAQPTASRTASLNAPDNPVVKQTCTPRWRRARIRVAGTGDRCHRPERLPVERLEPPVGSLRGRLVTIDKVAQGHERGHPHHVLDIGDVIVAGGVEGVAKCTGEPIGSDSRPNETETSERDHQRNSIVRLAIVRRLRPQSSSTGPIEPQQTRKPLPRHHPAFTTSPLRITRLACVVDTVTSPVELNDVPEHNSP